MSAKASTHYLYNKYVHEMRRDNYEMDMLRLIASAYMKEPPPRYFNLLDAKQTSKTKHIEYDVNDVVDMFRGTGKLCG